MIDTKASASELLVSILLCGIVGMMGQGIRSIVGLKNLHANDAAPNQQSVFNVAYLMYSFMIGFIAGVVAGFVTGLANFQSFNLNDTKSLLAIAVSGYAGADFIENSLSLIIPHQGAKTSAPAGPTGGGPSNAPAPVTPIIFSPGPARSQIVADVAGDGSSDLASALRIVAPRVRLDKWLAPLQSAFQKFDLSNDKRKAAAVGQFLVEAGAAFQEVVENTNYTSAERLHTVFPHAFATVEEAERYVGKPEAIANRAYANRLGNGDEASGDGYRFRGRGLIQLTGRDEYKAFATTVGMTAEQASTYLETPEGAAMSGCWYLAANHCLPLADAWDISKITRIVNGPAMLGNSERIRFSDAMLKALGGALVS